MPPGGMTAGLASFLAFLRFPEQLAPADVCTGSPPSTLSGGYGSSLIMDFPEN